MALAFDQYKEPLIRTVKQELNIGGKTIPLIRPTGLGDDGGLLGAAAIAVLELNHFG